MQLTKKQKDFLRNPYVGVVTTVRPDGTPHSTVVWVDTDNGHVVFNTVEGRAKPRNLRRDPHVSVTVVDPDDPYRWLAVTGTAALTHEGADEQIDDLARKYLGEERYPWRNPEEERVLVRIEPEQVDSYGLD